MLCPALWAEAAPGAPAHPGTAQHQVQNERMLGLTSQSSSLPLLALLQRVSISIFYQKATVKKPLD